MTEVSPQVKFLYRGMADMQLDTSGPFLQHGGESFAVVDRWIDRKVDRKIDR